MTRHASLRRAAAAPLLALTATLAAAVSARADVAVDPIGDFLPTYVGVRGGDLDVVTTEGVYDGVNLVVKATLNGRVGQTTGGFFVFGFQRGAGTARLAAVASNVLFDSVLTVTPGSPTALRDLVTGVATTLPAGATVINGAQLTVTFPAAQLPSQGLKVAQFQLNLWPRSGGTNDLIADFAPNNSDVVLSLAFPTPAAASAQTEIAVDNGVFLFDGVSARLGERRGDPAATGAGGGSLFITAGGRHGASGLSGSAISKSDMGQIAGGFDYAVGQGLVIGVGASGSITRAKLGPSGSLRVKSATGMAYGTWGGAGGLHLDALAAYSSLSMDSSRTIPIGPAAFSGQASPKGHAFTAGARAGYAMTNGGFTWGPTVDLVSTRAKIDAYAEIGAADFGAAVAGRTRQSTRLGVGLEVAKSTAASWGKARGRVSARVVQEMGDRDDPFSYAFTAQPTTSFPIAPTRLARTYGVLDLGVDAQVGPETLIGLSYSPRFDKDGVVDQALFASARVSF